jgi:phage terminase large subunit-like protein
MTEPSKKLEEFVLAGKLTANQNPVLRWCLDNLVVTVDPAECVKPAKDKATERIDAAVALIMALGRGFLHVNQRSVYEDRGLVVL